MDAESLLRRIRWVNVARAAALVALAALAVALPRLHGPAVDVPPDTIVPVAPGAAETIAPQAGTHGGRATGRTRAHGHRQRRAVRRQRRHGRRVVRRLPPPQRIAGRPLARSAPPRPAPPRRATVVPSVPAASPRHEFRPGPEF